MLEDVTYPRLAYVSICTLRTVDLSAYMKSRVLQAAKGLTESQVTYDIESQTVEHVTNINGMSLGCTYPIQKDRNVVLNNKFLL